MKPTKPKLIALSSLLLAATVGAQTFTGMDVGGPALAGSATSNPNGTISIKGGGADIWGTSDQFYFYYTTLTTPNWEVIFQLHDLQGPDWWSKCELMVRLPQGPEPTANDAFIAHMATRAGGENRVGPQWRPNNGVDCGNSYFNMTVNPKYPSTWLRIKRAGSVFSLYQAVGGGWEKYADFDTANVSGTPGTPAFTTSPWPNTVFVGVAVTAHNNSDPTGAIATISDLAVIPSWPQGVSLEVTKQPVNATNYAGSPVTFSCGITNKGTVAGLVNFQWYKNGKPVFNGNASTVSFMVDPADDGADVYCVGSYGATSITTATAKVGVLPATQVTGLKYQAYPGKSRAQVRDFTAGAAGRVTMLPGFEAPVGWADNYSARVSGYFIPPVTGDYVFFIAADDDAELYLSTNSEPSNLRMIAQQIGWAPHRGWDPSLGDQANPSQRRSDTFSPDGMNVPFQYGIPLVQGQPYFIMGTHQEGGGGDNFDVTFKVNGDPVYGSDPQSGPGVPEADWSPSAMTNTMVRSYLKSNTVLSITQQPVPTTVFENLDATLTVVTSTDGELTPYYQWQKNGVDMPGKNAATLTFSPSKLSDDGMYKCVITVPGTPLTQTSAEVKLTVQASVFVNGLVKQEIWGPGAGDQTRTAIENGTAGLPTTTRLINMFDQPDFADNYGQRLSTWFKPPQDGRYCFFLCSDDDSDLFLSTDDDPANKRLIAQQAGWNGTRQWNGGMNLSQRNSETFTPDSGATYPGQGGYQLFAANTYYLEAVHHEGGGGDNLSAYYALYTGGTPPSPPADNTESNIRGTVVGIKLPAPTTLDITQQPQDVTVDVYFPATFTIAATSDALYPPSYQWRRGGVPIAGATTTRYSFNTVQGDNNAQFDCVVSLNASPLVRTSRVATLTVNADTVPPQVLGAGALAKSDGTTIELGLEFNERLDHTSATNIANYTLSKGVVTGVRHYTWVGNTTFDAVALEVTGLVNNDTVNVTVKNVKDFSLNVIADTTKSVTVNTAFRYAIVGGRELFNAPPAGTTAADWPDDAIALGNGGYLTLSACNGHWDAYDEQTFVYEALTGNFERVVRVQMQDNSSNWGRAGLMAREELLEGVDRGTMAAIASRNLNIRCNPTFQWNGSPANNQIEAPRRTMTGGTYSDAGGTGGTPAYPNQWLRIKRTNDVLTTYHSANNGATWVSRGTWDATGDPIAPLASTLYVGPFYAPEMNNNNTAAGVGHSTKAIFRSFGTTIPTPPALKVTKSGDSIVLQWDAGTMLQSANAPEGPYTDTGNTSGSLTKSIGAGPEYFRAVRK